jgi:Tol biopolymer transport system component
VVTIDSVAGTRASSKKFLSLLDLERGILSRFTIGDVEEEDPLWSPDQESIVFTSRRNGKNGLYRRSAAGGATSDQELLTSADDLDATGFSPDNDILLFRRGSIGTGRIWALPLIGDREAIQVIPGFDVPQYQASFSPDGKWIVFGAGEGAGKGEIFIQPFPADDRRVQISREAGRYPHWTSDGRSIIYRTANDDFMIVELTPAGRTFKPSVPKKLFNSPKALPGTYTYGLDARGEKFLMVVPPDNTSPIVAAPLTIVVNWVQNLKKE